MTPREELELLRKQQGPLSKREELEIMRKEQGPIESFANEAPKRAWGSLVAPIGAISEFADSYVGAPLRAGVKKAQELSVEEQNQGKNWVPPKAFAFENVPEIAGAVAGQFGKDPTTAPTWGKLMGNYGVSEKPLSVPDLENFGNPNARFKEGKSSLADITGALVGTAADPVNLIPFGKTGHYLQKALSSTASGARRAPKAAVRAGAQFLGQVKPDDFNYYVENQGRLKGREFTGFDPIKQDILNDADVVHNQVKKAEIRVRETKDALAQAKKTLTDKINEGMNPSLDEVEAFQKLVDEDKAMQGYLSNAADEALGKLKIKVRTSHVKQLVQDEIDSIKVNTAPEAQRRANLQDLLIRLDEKGPLMNGPMLRDWMQSVRSELGNFQLSPGVYDTQLSKHSKNISERVSDFLKKQGEENLPGSPKSEYRQIMDIMAPYAKASEEVAEMFSTPQKGASTLKALHQGTPVIGEDVERKLRNYATASESPEIGELVDKKLELRDFANKIKSEGEESYLRKESDALNWAEHDLSESKLRTKDIKGLTDTGADTVINNLSHSPTGLTSRSEYADQLTRLGEMVPRPKGSLPYETQIRDQGVLKRFDQERPSTGYIVPAIAGFGGTLGTAIGGAPGAIVGTGAGTMAGMAMSKRGGKIARGIIDKSIALDRAIPARQALQALENKLNNPSPQFQKYMKIFEKYAPYGAKGVLLYHHLLWNNDPEYRKALSEEP
jgi:hypothetical protein